jgi:hypothetical protein
MSSGTLDKPLQVWTNPKSAKDKPSLVCLKPDSLWLAVVPTADLDKTAAALKNGGEVVAQHIPLARITQLQGDEGDSEVTVTYKQGESQTGEVTITFADRSTCDQFRNALANRLGSGWQWERRQIGRLSLSLWPLVTTAVVAVVTGFMYFEAHRIAAGEHLKSPFGDNARLKLVSLVMHWVEGLIGTTGVLILGGLLLTLCIVWWVYEVAHPPVRITVRPQTILRA